MKRVVLIFPDTTTIADFIVKQKVSNAQVDSIEQTLTSSLSDKQIAIAETVYKAMVKKLTSN